MTLVPASSHSPVVSAVKDLTTAQIAALGSTPVTIIAAIPGRSIVPLGGVFAYDAGAVGFAGTGDSLGLGYVGFSAILITNPALSGTVDQTVTFYDSASRPVVPTADLVLSAGDPVLVGGTIATSSLAAGGADYVVGDTATVNGGASGLITASTVAKQFPIVSVATVAKTFTVTGNAAAVITVGTGLKVIRSTGNDGSYTVVSSIFGAGQTVITVNEAVPDATGDGKAEPDDGTGGAILTYALTNGGSGYTVAVHAVSAVGPSVGGGASINVLTITSPSDGTARVTVYYAVV